MRQFYEKAIEEDLKICIGIGATIRVGSDSYPYYVSEMLPNGVLGMYSPKARFDDKHPWESGYGAVDPFDDQHKSEFYIKRRYGQWWKTSSDGKPLEKWTSKWHHLSFGHASYYQDPSF